METRQTGFRATDRRPSAGSAGDTVARLNSYSDLMEEMINRALVIDRGERPFDASFVALACRVHPALAEAEPDALIEVDWPHFREMLASLEQQLLTWPDESR